jgi:hypothetical protein
MFTNVMDYRHYSTTPGHGVRGLAGLTTHVDPSLDRHAARDRQHEQNKYAEFAHNYAISTIVI